MRYSGSYKFEEEHDSSCVDYDGNKVVSPLDFVEALNGDYFDRLDLVREDPKTGGLIRNIFRYGKNFLSNYDLLKKILKDSKLNKDGLYALTASYEKEGDQRLNLYYYTKDPSDLEKSPLVTALLYSQDSGTRREFWSVLDTMFFKLFDESLPSIDEVDFK